MFRLALKTSTQFSNQIVRQYGKTYGALKVAICGAAGKSGQTLALLLKACPLIDELALYDVSSTATIALELNHIDTNCNVIPYKRDIRGALRNSHVVAIIASGATSRGLEHNFPENAEIVLNLVSAISEHCPKVFQKACNTGSGLAFIAIATNPVNSMVPLASEVLKHHGVYNKNHVFGVTTLDVMRTNTIVSQKLGVIPENVHVPCVGGHEKTTAVPILSQTKPKTDFSDEEILAITEEVQNAHSRLGDGECGSTYLSGALATAQFVISLVRAIKGEKNVVETCLIKSNVYPNMSYLATPIVLGTDGVTKNLGVPHMTDYEKCLFQNSRETLREDIQRGEDYAKCIFGQIYA